METVSAHCDVTWVKRGSFAGPVGGHCPPHLSVSLPPLGLVSGNREGYVSQGLSPEPSGSRHWRRSSCFCGRPIERGRPWANEDGWGRAAGRIYSPGGKAPWMQTVITAGWEGPLQTCKLDQAPLLRAKSTFVPLYQLGIHWRTSPRCSAFSWPTLLSWEARWHNTAPRLRQAPCRPATFPLGGLRLVTQPLWTLIPHLTNGRNPCPHHWVDVKTKRSHMWKTLWIQDQCQILRPSWGLPLLHGKNLVLLWTASWILITCPEVTHFSLPALDSKEFFACIYLSVYQTPVSMGAGGRDLDLIHLSSLLCLAHDRCSINV